MNWQRRLKRKQNQKKNPPFDPDDPGCGPAIIDVTTGRPLPDSHPEVILAKKLWMETPVEERRAFYSVAALSSEDPEDMRIALLLTEKLQIALKSQKVQA